MLLKQQVVSNNVYHRTMRNYITALLCCQMKETFLPQFFTSHSGLFFSFLFVHVVVDCNVGVWEVHLWHLAWHGIVLDVMNNTVQHRLEWF